MGVADRGSVEGNFDRVRFESGLLVSFLPPLPLLSLRTPRIIGLLFGDTSLVRAGEALPLLSLRTPRIIGLLFGDTSLVRAGDGLRDMLDGEAIVVMMEFPIEPIVMMPMF
jgi:hypothetical protein